MENKLKKDSRSSGERNWFRLGMFYKGTGIAIEKLTKKDGSSVLYLIKLIPISRLNLEKI